MSGTYLAAEVVYTPSEAHFNGQDTLFYEVIDNTIPSGMETMSCQLQVLVAAQDDAPVAANDNATTAEDTEVKIPVTANDSDIDGTGIMVDANYTLTVSPAAGGTAEYYDAPVYDRENFIRFVPAEHYHGVVTFSYRLTDKRTPVSSRLTDTATVTVTITAVEDAPIAVEDGYTVTEDSPAQSQAVLANDIDHDNMPASNTGLCVAAITTAPNNGGTAVVGAGACPSTIDYTPAPNYNGLETYYYTVTDPEGNESEPGAVVVTVTPVNDAPEAADDDAVVNENESVLVDVLANDYTPDAINGITLVIAPTGMDLAASNGAVEVEGSALRYTPNPGYFGLDAFDYTIEDSRAVQATATVHVVVTEVPTTQAPTTTARPSTAGPICGKRGDVFLD